MSRMQAAIVGLPFIAATIAYSGTDSDFVPFAWVVIVGESLAVIYLVLAYLLSDRWRRHRRDRPVHVDPRGNWRSYQWPRD